MAKTKQKKGVTINSVTANKRLAHYDKPERGEDGHLHSRASADQSKRLAVPREEVIW